MKSYKKMFVESACTSFQVQIQNVFNILLLPILFLVFGCSQNKKEQQPIAQQELVQMESSMQMTTIDSVKTKVAILVFPGVELLDFSGPAEVFRYTKGFEVYTVSSEGKTVSTNKKTISLNADYTFDNAPQPDILVVPGGPLEVMDAVGDKKVIDWIKNTDEGTTVTMSVCTGALLLSRSGLLDGKMATTHLVALDLFQEWNPKVKFTHNGRFVQDGKMLTSGGVSAGIDGALHVVESLKGLKEALNITSIMEYNNWDPNDGLVLNTDNFPLAKDDREKGMNLYDPKTTYAVCKFPIGDEALKYNSTYEGQEYHFCSAACKNIFDKNPLVFSAH